MILVVEVFFTILCPLYDTMVFVAQCQNFNESNKPKYRHFVQWGIYWSFFASLNFITSCFSFNEDFQRVVNYCKVFILVLLGHPQLHGAYVFYREIFEDLLVRKRVYQYLNNLYDGIFDWFNFIHYKYMKYISRLDNKAKEEEIVFEVLDN